jgi:hypothetical protein
MKPLVRLKVLTAGTTKITGLLGVTPYNLEELQMFRMNLLPPSSKGSYKTRQYTRFYNITIYNTISFPQQ